MEQAELLKYLLGVLDRLHISYAIVGSFASGIWGEVRFTQDIDLITSVQECDLPQLLTLFSPPEFYASLPAAQEAVRNASQFNIIHLDSGNKIDFMIAGTSQWSQRQLQRSHIVQMFPDQTGRVSSPEDVILGKLLYYREGGSDKHLRDIAGIVKVSGDTLDWEYLAQSALELELVDLWNSVQEACR